jgi:hypothetical protein
VTSFVSECPWTTKNPLMNPSTFIINFDQISKGMCWSFRSSKRHNHHWMTFYNKGGGWQDVWRRRIEMQTGECVYLRGFRLKKPSLNSPILNIETLLHSWYLAFPIVVGTRVLTPFFRAPRQNLPFYFHPQSVWRYFYHIVSYDDMLFWDSFTTIRYEIAVRYDIADRPPTKKTNLTPEILDHNQDRNCTRSRVK